ncbi:hypothetical protein ACH4TX_27215 [Streptomyces sp. NPDC021098]|uniref:hypothetical protein n=1 Tax=unclassified Streptomyces TaxID=2593676 RepID=UPI00379B9072
MTLPSGDALRAAQDHNEPLVPMPALTLSALRSAAGDTTAPLRMFYRRWGTVVAIERIPERAARMHAAEQVLHTSPRADARQTALHEIGAIVQAAQGEVEALETE